MPQAEDATDPTDTAEGSTHPDAKVAIRAQAMALGFDAVGFAEAALAPRARHDT